uniref:Uncharacterized protein n=1 Tax=Arundo donax TaxID=35708 RepID=A0A0A9AIK5_ARUDO
MESSAKSAAVNSSAPGGNTELASGP